MAAEVVKALITPGPAVAVAEWAIVIVRTTA